MNPRAPTRADHASRDPDQASRRRDKVAESQVDKFSPVFRDDGNNGRCWVAQQSLKSGMIVQAKSRPHIDGGYFMVVTKVAPMTTREPEKRLSLWDILVGRIEWVIVGALIVALIAAAVLSRGCEKRASQITNTGSEG